MRETMRFSARYAGYVAVFALLWTVAAGCATTPEVELKKTYQFDADAPATQAMSAWFDGERPEIADPISAEELFVAAEADYWEGNLEAAYQRYVAMLRDHPGHGLNRYAVHRLYRLRFDVIEFAPRIVDDLQEVSYDSESALTRLELMRLSHEVGQELWRRSDASEPFDSAQVGMIHQWRVTPALSPWRLLDFDEEMAPEQTDRLQESYLSPRVGVDDPANRDMTKTISVDRLGERMQLGSSGIYYLESQLTVEGNRSRDITLSGRFPGAARVWIDGEEVLERREEAYEPGRVMRQIELEPGDHRVLVKLAYRSGSRDWFELGFVPMSGNIWADAGLRAQPELKGAPAGVTLRSEQHDAAELEPVVVAGDISASEMSSSTLYAATLSAYASGEYEAFEAAWEALMERHPEFAAGHLLGSYQVRMRWDVPSQLRESLSISRLRRAEELAPDNLHVLVRLERSLRDRGEDSEHRRVLERARELALNEAPPLATGSAQAGATIGETKGGHSGTNIDTGAVRQLRPLVSWARHLQRKGWSQQAEEAWREVLEINPNHCTAVRQLYGLYRSRNYFPDADALSSQWNSCPRFVDRWVRDHPNRLDDRLEFAAQQAGRYPYDATRQRSYADILRSAGDRDKAAEVLADATDKMPDESQLWRARVELAMGDGDNAQARALLDEASARLGNSSRLEWKKARLDDELPLQGLMRDGLEAARDEIERTTTSDEIDEDSFDEDERAMGLDDAYYVVDFAGRKYFEDGSSWTLTHQIVRVMTRGAIDRYAEMTVPSGAYLLKARTIKEDGEVRMPDGVSGDSTLSMPGLARGDMVEMAYLQFRGPRRVASQVSGGRFYFQMANVSSRHSEYVVIGTEEMGFESANGAPEPEKFEWDGREATRFVQRDSRRPRSEPRRVNAQEYLPWVREVRPGVDEPTLDVERLYQRESLVGSVRPSPVVDEKVESWLGRELDGRPVTDDEVQRLYYGTAAWIRQISARSFGTDAAHIIQQRQGSPFVILHLVLTQLGVDHDVYLARTDEQPLKEQAVGEVGRYRRAVLRITMPESGRVKWVQMQRRDAMFGALDPEIDGQRAVCITCDEFRRDTVKMEDEKRPRRHIDVAAQLDEQGHLSGTLDYRFDGIRAVRVRAALRNRSDEEDRRAYFEQVLTGQISGADLQGVEISGEDEPGEPLRFEVKFTRDGFARASQDGLIIDRPIFREAMQRIYTQPSSRHTSMFVGYEREQSYSLSITVPENMEARLRAVDVEEATTAFGDFDRRAWMEDGVLRLETSIRLPRQRIAADDYGEFRQWTRTVEESAELWLGLSANLGDGPVEPVDG